MTSEEKEQARKQAMKDLESQKYKSKTPFMEDVIESESLIVGKTLEFKGKARQRIFGADEIMIPEGFDIHKLVDYLNEEEMVELNIKLY